MQFLQGFGVQVIQALQALSPVLDGLARIFSLVGTPAFYLLLLPPLYWAAGKRIGKMAILALVFSALLCLVLKQLLHQPRPYWLGIVQPLATEATYGNPSSSAGISLAVLGYLAYRFDKAWLWAAASLCIIAIGFSRLYLGVQFPLGVLFGWLLGLGVLAMLVWLDRRSTSIWAGLPDIWPVGFAFGASLLILLAGFAIRSLIASSPDPATWAAHATGARSLIEYFTLAGGLFGLLSGYALMKNHAGFQTTGTWLTKTGRCLLGFAGLGVIIFSLGWLTEQLFTPETLPVYILGFLQVALITFWVLFGAPWFFLKVGMAEPADNYLKKRKLALSATIK